MDITTAKEALLKRSNAFQERYFTAYGQLVLRVNEETYISSRENLRLSKLTEKDFDLFDINTGDIGRIFSSRNDINAIVFICTEAAVRFSKENQIMRPALDDLTQIIGPDVTVCPDGTARTLLKALRNRRGCFIQGSGIIAVGDTIEEAIAGARILEKSAEAEIYSGKLNGLQYLDPTTAQELHKYYDGSYSKVNQKEKVDFISSGAEEFQLRNRIIDCGKDMSRSELEYRVPGKYFPSIEPGHHADYPVGHGLFFHPHGGHRSHEHPRFEIRHAEKPLRSTACTPRCTAGIRSATPSSTPTPTASVHSLQPTPDSGFRNRRWIS